MRDSDREERDVVEISAIVKFVISLVPDAHLIPVETVARAIAPIA